MPTYVYKFVETGETIEVQQAFSDDTLREVAHPETGALMPVKKVFTPVGVTFKGSGFFKTDNRGKKAAASSPSDSTSSSESTTKATDSSSGTAASSSESSSSTPAAAPAKPAASTSSTD
jgi:predicted nucleic acid-binding Zn ribbon protein